MDQEQFLKIKKLSPKSKLYIRVSYLGSLSMELMEPAKRVPGQNLHLYGFKHEESEV